MNKKIITLLVLAFVSLSINAQSNDLLVGKWILKKAISKEKDAMILADTLKSSQASKISFEFKADGKFDSSMMGDTKSGTWVLTKDDKKLVLNTDEPPVELDISKLTKSELHVTFGYGELILIRK